MARPNRHPLSQPHGRTRTSFSSSLLLSLLLLLISFQSVISIDGEIFTFLNNDPKMRAQSKHSKRAASVSRFRETHQTLVRAIDEVDTIVEATNLMNSTNSTKMNGTIDNGDAPKVITDGVSVFESLPEIEANVLVDMFDLGKDATKWVYPTGTMLDASGSTNSTKLSYGFVPIHARKADQKKIDYENEQQGGMWFKGDAQGTIPVRSRHPFSKGVNVRVSLQKSAMGNGPSHFVVLATNPEFKYRRYAGEKTDGFRTLIKNEVEKLVKAEEDAKVLQGGSINSTNSTNSTLNTTSTTNGTRANTTNSTNSTGSVSQSSNGTNATNATTNAPEEIIKIEEKKENLPPVVDPKDGKYVVVTWHNDRLVLFSKFERRSMECSYPTNYTLNIQVDGTDGKIRVTGCGNDDTPLLLLDPKATSTFTTTDSFYVYLGADHETPTKEIIVVDPLDNTTSVEIVVDIEKMVRLLYFSSFFLSSSFFLLTLFFFFFSFFQFFLLLHLQQNNRTGPSSAVFDSIKVSEMIDRYFQCAHRSSDSSLQHDFFEDFESGRLSSRWVVQRPISEEKSTQTKPAYGIGGATSAEAGVAKEIFWLNGDRGYSLRARRPFFDAVKVEVSFIAARLKFYYFFVFCFLFLILFSSLLYFFLVFSLLFLSSSSLTFSPSHLDYYSKGSTMFQPLDGNFSF